MKLNCLLMEEFILVGALQNVKLVHLLLYNFFFFFFKLFCSYIFFIFFSNCSLDLVKILQVGLMMEVVKKHGLEVLVGVLDMENIGPLVTLLEQF